MMKPIAIALLIAGWLAAGPLDAQAQSMGTFKGYLTGHAGVITGDALSNENLSVGGSMAVQDDSGWGAELDLGHSADAVAGRQVLDVTSYMVNASWVKPFGMLRPFGIAGVGLLQVDGCDSPCNIPARTSDLGVSIGGGAFLALRDFAGLRADARYFYSSAGHPELHRPDHFSYWRISLGATFMWAAVP
jgi:hypothetical protein